MLLSLIHISTDVELEMISTKVEKEGKTQAEAQTHRPL